MVGDVKHWLLFAKVIFHILIISHKWFYLTDDVIQHLLLHAPQFFCMKRRWLDGRQSEYLLAVSFEFDAKLLLFRI